MYLEQHHGRSKRVVLTEKGKDYVKHTAAKIYQAELAAFESWTEEEINAYIGLMEKYVASLRSQIESIERIER